LLAQSIEQKETDIAHCEIPLRLLFTLLPFLLRTNGPILHACPIIKRVFVHDGFILYLKDILGQIKYLMYSELCIPDMPQFILQ